MAEILYIGADIDVPFATRRTYTARTMDLHFTLEAIRGEKATPYKSPCNPISDLVVCDIWTDSGDDTHALVSEADSRVVEIDIRAANAGMCRFDENLSTREGGTGNCLRFDWASGRSDPGGEGVSARHFGDNAVSDTGWLK